MSDSVVSSRELEREGSPRQDTVCPVRELERIDAFTSQRPESTATPAASNPQRGDHRQTAHVHR